jgi:uncharacterized protein
MMLAPVAATVVVLVVLLAGFASMYTDLLWFREVGSTSDAPFSRVFSTVLVTKILLFILYAVVMAAVVGFNVWVAYRLRPPFRPQSLEQQNLDRYRLAIEPRLRTILFGGMVVVGLMAGGQGASHWQTWQLFFNRVPFGGDRDPVFGKDMSFFAFQLPFFRLLVGFIFGAVFFATLLSAATHYLFGGIRLQFQGEKVAPAARAHLSVLLGVLAALKAVFYLLDRYSLAFSVRGSVTGASYTDIKIRMPGLTVMIFAASLCAVLFIANLRSRGWLLPSVAMGLLVVASLVVGFIIPALVQQLRVRPNELRYESPYIARNITATRRAYGIDDVTYSDFEAESAAGIDQLRKTGATLDNVRLLDPNKLTRTFEQLQEIRGFFGFASTLDIDRYTTQGKQQDYVVGVRELDLAGLAANQKGQWLNQHVLFTHGSGFVAVAADAVTTDGKPDFSEKDLPPVGFLDIREARIYYGEKSPAYSVVHSPTTGEADGVDDAVAGKAGYRYTGKGGVRLSGLRKLMYAIRFREPNMLISSAVGTGSRVMYIRNPRERVMKVAPFLKLDSDPYPAVIDGRIQWILDGYTTSAGFPYSQKVAFDEVTTDTSTTLRQRQAAEKITYIRNSVKATVDSFDGTVKLYSWDEQDPVLKAWKKVFPNIVRPRSEMPSAVLEHVRYPEDLFKVQRELIARYHVTDPTTFFTTQEEWAVPIDAAGARDAQRRLIETDPQPPYYVLFDADNDGKPAFSLTTPFVFRGKENLAAFASVSSDGADYGKISVSQVPKTRSILGPGQVASAFITDARFSRDETQFSSGQSQVIYGNLLTLPIGQQLLYVQPIYLEGRAGATYPTLQKVLVGYGNKVGYGDRFDQALADAVSAVGGTTPPAGGTPTPTPGATVSPTPGASPPVVSRTIAEAVQEALAAEAASTAALQKNPPDFAAYDAAQRRLRAALARLQQLASASATPSPTPGR